MAMLISVIVPVYNAVSYLEECVQSVLAQTYSSFQLILVDDGSDDGSGELCEKLSRDDPRIHAFHQEHGGVAAARNAAMLFSGAQCHQNQTLCGEYLFFLDSDDSIHPELLKVLCSLAEETKAAIISADFMRVEEGDQIPLSAGDVKGHIYLNNQELLHDFWTKSEIMSNLGTIGGKLLRRDVVKNLLFDETLDYGEDTKFLYQLLVQGADAVFHDQKWYYYRQHSSNSSSRETPKMHYDRYQCYKYLSCSELAEGRRTSAEKAERQAIDCLVNGYCLSRFKHDRKAMSFWKKLGWNEHQTAEFSLLAVKYRVKYGLILYTYPLYVFLCYTMRLFRRKRGT